MPRKLVSTVRIPSGGVLRRVANGRTTPTANPRLSSLFVAFNLRSKRKQGQEETSFLLRSTVDNFWRKRQTGWQQRDSSAHQGTYSAFPHPFFAICRPTSLVAAAATTKGAKHHLQRAPRPALVAATFLPPRDLTLNKMPPPLPLRAPPPPSAPLLPPSPPPPPRIIPPLQQDRTRRLRPLPPPPH